MRTKPIEHYEARAKVAKAMGHASRLLIIDLLQEKERCVCELTEAIGVDQSTVSRHLGVLKQAGLIEDRKEGVMMFYRLRVTCLEGFWQCIESVLRQNLEAQRAAIGT